MRPLLPLVLAAVLLAAPAIAEGESCVEADGAASCEASAKEAPFRLEGRSPVGAIVERVPDIHARGAGGVALAAARTTMTLDGASVAATVDGARVEHRPKAPLATGAHRVTIRAEDANGRAATADWTFLVLPPRVEGERAWALAPEARGRVELPLRDARLLLDGAEVALTRPETNLTIEVERLATLPSTLPAPPGSPVVVASPRLRSETSLGSVAIREIEYAFVVPAPLLAPYGATPDRVLAMAFEDGAWRALPRSGATANATEARFTAGTERLAPIAVVADLAEPSIGPFSPPDGAMLRASPTLRVFVSDNVQLENVLVTVDGAIVHADESEARVLVAELGDLRDGRHTVEVRARDAAGNANARAWSFVLDRAAPTFPTVTPRIASTEHSTIEIALSDGVTGVDPASVRVTLDGRDVTADATVAALAVTYNAAGLEPGPHTLVVEARDRAGNVASYTHAFTLDAGVAAVPGPALAVALAGVAVALVLRRAAGRT